MEAFNKVGIIGLITALAASVTGSIAAAAKAPEWLIGGIVGACIMAGLMLLASDDF